MNLGEMIEFLKKEQSNFSEQDRKEINEKLEKLRLLENQSKILTSRKTSYQESIDIASGLNNEINELQSQISEYEKELEAKNITYSEMYLDERFNFLQEQIENRKQELNKIIKLAKAQKANEYFEKITDEYNVNQLNLTQKLQELENQYEQRMTSLTYNEAYLDEICISLQNQIENCKLQINEAKQNFERQGTSSYKQELDNKITILQNKIKLLRDEEQSYLDHNQINTTDLYVDDRYLDFQNSIMLLNRELEKLTETRKMQDYFIDLHDFEDEINKLEKELTKMNKIKNEYEMNFQKEGILYNQWTLNEEYSKTVNSILILEDRIEKIKNSLSTIDERNTLELEINKIKENKEKIMRELQTIINARQPKEEAPKEEAPKEEVPKEEAPKEEAPKEEAPKEEAPKEVAPKEEAPKDVAPKDVVPKEVASKEEAPKDVAPKEVASKEEAPKEEAPKDVAPKEVASKEGAPKEEASKEADSIESDLTDVKYKKIEKAEHNLELFRKSMLGLAGFATGYALSTVPGVGTIRMTIAGLKLVSNVVNIYSEKFPESKITKVISNVEHKEKTILKKYPKIDAGITKIKSMLKDEKVNIFINGLSLGYLTGNIVEILKGTQIFEKAEPSINPDVDASSDNLVIATEQNILDDESNIITDSKKTINFGNLTEGHVDSYGSEPVRLNSKVFAKDNVYFDGRINNGYYLISNDETPLAWVTEKQLIDAGISPEELIESAERKMKI